MPHPRMTRLLRRTTATFFLILAAFSARADFYKAYKSYQEKNFEEAAVLFRELAELGHGPSQFNLGVMHVRGEAMEKNQGIGLGWMQAAAENGYAQMSAQQIADFKARLSPEQVADGDRIVAQFGRSALERTLLPGRAAVSCRNFQLARVEQRARSYYPVNALRDRRDGVVLVELTVGTDGLARDPHVLVSVPERIFDDATINAYLKSRFVPAQRDGKKIESRLMFHFTFYLEEGGALWKLKSVEKLKESAEQKNPNAQYIVGMIGSMDPTLQVPRDEARSMLLAAAQAGHPNAQYWAAHQLQIDQLCGDGNKVLTWLEHAAKGGDSSAQIELANLRLSRGSGDVNIEQTKQWLASAAGRDNPYVLKHAIAILAASPVEALRDPNLALTAAEQLKKYGSSLDPHVDEAIAAAYGANGNFRDAAKMQERAVEQAEDLFWNTQAMEERLAGYKAGKAYAEGDLFAVPPAKTPPPPVQNEARDCSKSARGCGRLPDKQRAPTGSFIKE